MEKGIRFYKIVGKPCYDEENNRKTANIEKMSK